MTNTPPYIKQQAEDETLYSRLQKQTLEEVQRLSGKVWTDFNPHDPGVTLADIANYALAETGYKLSFAPADYLTKEGEHFQPQRFGLFPPGEVYTTTPVTAEDYRKLFFSHIPEIENIWVECNPATGGYTVKIDLSPFEEQKNDIVKQIKAIYNSHRNLCEYLDRVIVVQPEELDFQAEFEIEPGEDATHVLAGIYHTILHYLSGSVIISTPGEQALSGMSPEEWLEGSEDALRVEIPQKQNTEYELYKELWKVKGIKSFSTCYLMKDGEPQTDFSQGFNLKIPRKEEELKVRIRCGHSLMQVDMDKFTERLKALYYAEGRVRAKKIRPHGYQWESVEGTHRDIFTHYPLAGDFPACYRLSPNRKTPTSFEAYLQLYDLTIQNGLKEIEELPRLLSIENGNTDFSTLRDIYTLKSRYLDFLDSLYGVESQPAWMKEFGNYGETKDEILHRRTSFLRHVARLTKNRARAQDITIPDRKENIAAAKEWFCRLLGIDRDESRSVGNVLPAHNLALMRTEGKGKHLHDRLTAMLIDEQMLNSSNVEAIVPEKLPEDDREKLEQYERLRTELPVFNHNLISGGLFRGGIYLDNYRIVQADRNEYMLVFHNREEGNRMNLGRSNNKAELNLLANILRRYLQELNRACETLYIVEPVLSGTSRPFTLSLVLPSWTSRFHSPRFREVCRECLRSLLPAHLTGTIYWLNVFSMQEFEYCYRRWRQALAKQDAKSWQKKMDEVLNRAKAQPLDDTH